LSIDLTGTKSQVRSVAIRTTHGTIAQHERCHVFPQFPQVWQMRIHHVAGVEIRHGYPLGQSTRAEMGKGVFRGAIRDRVVDWIAKFMDAG
jgi:hypothetical protein